MTHQDFTVDPVRGGIDVNAVLSEWDVDEDRRPVALVRAFAHGVIAYIERCDAAARTRNPSTLKVATYPNRRDAYSVISNWEREIGFEPEWADERAQVTAIRDYLDALHAAAHLARTHAERELANHAGAHPAEAWRIDAALAGLRSSIAPDSARLVGRYVAEWEDGLDDLRSRLASERGGHRSSRPVVPPRPRYVFGSVDLERLLAETARRGDGDAATVIDHLAGLKSESERSVREIEAVRTRG